MQVHCRARRFQKGGLFTEDSIEAAGSQNEPQWFEDNGIADAIAYADGLWAVSPDVDAMARVQQAHWSEE